MPAPILPERPVLVAPDGFGDSFRACEVAAAIGRGLERAGLMPPDLCPVADGGGGTTDALLPVLGGEVVAARTHDQLGRPVTGSFALLEGGSTALVEAAAVDSRGAGELICAAADAGATAILVAAGAAAAPDGGVGALRAIEAHGGVRGARLVVLCPGGDRPPSHSTPGLAGALGRHGASLELGATWTLEALDFDSRMRAARAVVTGEGTLDSQSLEGRLVGEIGRRTRQAGVPLHAVVGRAELDGFGRRMIDLQRVLEAATLESLEAAGEQLGAELRDGRA